MLQDVVLLVLAVLPSMLIAEYIYKSDRADYEPKPLLWSLFLLGAVSCLPASLIEGLLDPVAADIFGANSLGYILVDYFLVVAVAEEGCKYFFLRLRTWKKPDFDYRFDGIVYAVMVGLGFATLENIMYVFTYGFGNGVVRALLSVPGHAGWAVIMGYYYGRMKMFDTVGDHAQYQRNQVCALLVPMLCHGIFDTLVSLPGDLVPFFGCVVFAVAIDVGVIRLVRSESASDEAILKQNGAAWGFSNYGMPAPASAFAPNPAYASASVPTPAPILVPVPGPVQGPVQTPAPTFTYTSAPGPAPSPAWAQAPAPAPVQAPSAMPPASKGFLGRWLGGYAATMLAVFLVAIFFTDAESPLFEYLTTVFAYMAVCGVPYAAIVVFAWRMRVRRERRAAHHAGAGTYWQPQTNTHPVPQAPQPQQPQPYQQQTSRRPSSYR